MCAINGCNFKDEGLVRRMNYATRHRGPDGSSIWSDGMVTLGHNRLAIIDVSADSAQPMKSHDGRFEIVYNGELYNFVELRQKIGSRYPFRTKGDTEVVLAAYELWGSECVDMFNGMFAFAIWDTKTKTLFLARDHAGIKPLYYYHQNGQFIFSSEVKGVLEASIPRMLNHDALAHYMRLSYVPEPYTLFAHVHSLPAASRAILKEGELSIERYWRLVDAPQNQLSIADATVRLHDILDRSVARQLVADRPVGIFLSGGLDSSAVLSAAAKVHPGIDTYTVRFALSDSADEPKFNADADLARTIAAEFGARHHEVIIEPSEVPQLLQEAARALDVPVSNPTIPSMMKLSENAVQTATVVLNGDGGDELFGGYTRYRYSARVLAYQRLVPTALRKLVASMHPNLHKAATPVGIDLFERFMFQKNATLRRAVTESLVTEATRDLYRSRYFDEAAKNDFIRLFMTADREGWLVDEALMRTDRTTMAYGLEARVPFLDREMLEFSATIPTWMKVDMRTTKKLPRKAFAQRLPAHIIAQKKRGWVSPGAKWLRHPQVQELARAAFSPGFHSSTDSLMAFDTLAQTYEAHIDGSQYNLYVLWSILTFRLWAHQWNVTV
jgi:asparagine synthase (glutamine-hydrolysing)